MYHDVFDLPHPIRLSHHRDPLHYHHNYDIGAFSNPIMTTEIFIKPYALKTFLYFMLASMRL